MKKLIACALVSLSVSVFAAEEQLSCRCQGAASIGFLWDNGSWQNQGFEAANYLFTIGEDSANATLVFSGYQWSFDNCLSSNIIRCSSAVGNSIVMNLSTGQGAVSSIVATALPPENESAIAFMERIECSRV